MPMCSLKGLTISFVGDLAWSRVPNDCDWRDNVRLERKSFDAGQEILFSTPLLLDRYH
jgi:hypothetical protein